MCYVKHLLQNPQLAVKHTIALWLSPWPLSVRLTGSDSISWKCEPTVTEIAGSVSLDVSSTSYASIFRALWLITNICAIIVSQKRQNANYNNRRKTIKEVQCIHIISNMTLPQNASDFCCMQHACGYRVGSMKALLFMQVQKHLQWLQQTTSNCPIVWNGTCVWTHFRIVSGYVLIRH